MPITFDNITVKLDSKGACENLLIRVEIPRGTVVTSLNDVYTRIAPEVHRLLTAFSPEDRKNLLLLKSSGVDNNSNTVTLGYNINKNLIIMKRGLPFPVYYCLSNVVKNRGALLEGFSVAGNMEMPNPDILIYSAQPNGNLLISQKEQEEEEEEEEAVTSQKWDNLYQNLHTKVEIIGQGYGVAQVTHNDDGILFLFHEDANIPDSTALAKQFVEQSMDVLVQECFKRRDTLYDELLEAVRVENTPPLSDDDDDTHTSFKLVFSEEVKPWCQAFLFMLQQKIEYARSFGVDPGLSLHHSPENGDYLIQSGSVVEVSLRCNIADCINHKAFISLLLNLPEDQDLLDMLRLMRLQDADKLDKELEGEYRERGSLLDCLANYYSCVTNNAPCTVLVLQAVLSWLESHGQKGTPYYNDIAGNILERIDHYISAMTPHTVDSKALQEEISLLKDQQLEFMIDKNQDPTRAKRTFFEKIGFSMIDQCGESTAINDLDFGTNTQTIMFLGGIIKQQKNMLAMQKVFLSTQKRNLQKTLSQESAHSANKSVGVNSRKRCYARSKSTSALDECKRTKTVQFFSPFTQESADQDVRQQKEEESVRVLPSTSSKP